MKIRFYFDCFCALVSLVSICAIFYWGGVTMVDRIVYGIVPSNIGAAVVATLVSLSAIIAALCLIVYGLIVVWNIVGGLSDYLKRRGV